MALTPSRWQKRRRPFRPRGSTGRRNQRNPSSRPNRTRGFSRASTYSRGTSIITDQSILTESTGPVNGQPPSRDAAREALLDDDDDICQVLMAVDIKERGTFGCSYYVAQEQKLYIMEDIVHGGLDVIDILKYEIEPTVVLLSTRADQGLEDMKKGVHDGTEMDSEFQFPYHLDVRPSQEFAFENARTKLSGLKTNSRTSETVKFFVPGDNFSDGRAADSDIVDFTEQQGNLLHLGGIVDMENRISIGCSGAIVTYLNRKHASEYLPGDRLSDQAIGIRAIETMSLQKTMSINKDTLTSLRIIRSESHPNAFNQGPGKTSSGSKESLSIYGLFYHFARTPQGKNLLRQYFLRPSTDPTVIRQRHDFIGIFLRPDNGPALTKLTKSLKSLKNLRPVMIHLQKGISTGSARFRGFKGVVWSTLLDFAFHAIDVHQTLLEVVAAEALDLRTKALLKLDLSQLHQVGRAIHETVDLSLSIEEHRTVVQPGIDRDLDNLKETYNGMEHLLSQVAVDIAGSLPGGASEEVNVIYFPQLGFNIAIPLSENGRPVYSGGNEGWNQVFTTENKAYFKDYRMREMDRKFGDIYGHICEKEIEIVYELAQNILTYEKMLVEASDVCGEVDSLLAFVQGASLNKLVRPRMTEDNIIDIEGGRHLLHEATVSSFVPNDTFIVGVGDAVREGSADDPSTPQGPSLLLLTGPNYSGKSVYLSQAAIAVYMAHIGSYVPANSAIIGYTDKILTRVSTRETVSKIQSTFANDLQQVSFALSQATNRSLIVIDEFGKGTESSDGAGLACGLFEYILSLGDQCPKVIAATHFHEIFENGFLTPRPELEFGHMEVRVDETAEDDNQIIYLYNFQLGRSSSSFGTNCAALAGIDPEIISRAKEIETLAHRGEDLVAACAKVTAAEMGELEEAENLARRFLAVDISKDLTGLSSEQSTPETIFSILDRVIENSKKTTPKQTPSIVDNST